MNTYNKTKSNTLLIKTNTSLDNNYICCQIDNKKLMYYNYDHSIMPPKEVKQDIETKIKNIDREWIKKFIESNNITEILLNMYLNNEKKQKEIWTVREFFIYLDLAIKEANNNMCLIDGTLFWVFFIFGLPKK